MKKTAYSLTVSVILLTLAACSNNSEADDSTNDIDNGTNNDSVLVETSAGNITEEEFITLLKEQYGDDVLQAMVENLVIASEAESLDIEEEEIQEEIDSLVASTGVTDEDQFYEMMQLQGVTGEDDLRQRVIKHLVMQHRIGHVGDVTEEELLAEYDAGEEVEARHILIEDEETAESLLERIEDGEDFGELAREYSQDPGSREDGGELNSFRRGTMTPSFEEAAFSLSLGELSEPVQSQFGYHIIEVTGRTPFTDDFDEVEEKLHSSLNERKLYKMSVEQDALMENVEINVIDEQFEHLFETAE